MSEEQTKPEQQADAEQAEQVQLESGDQEAVEAESQPQDTDAAEENALDIDDLLKRLEVAERTVVEQKDSVLRAAAEEQNVRRRAERDVANAHKFALEKFAKDLLPVVDTLERALDAPAAEDEASKISREGIELTLKMLLDAVKKHGVEPLDPTGEPFNPQEHEAMSMQPNPDMEPNTVMAVMQKGYSLNGRLIRPAMVMVSKAV